MKFPQCDGIYLDNIPYTNLYKQISKGQWQGRPIEEILDIKLIPIELDNKSLYINFNRLTKTHWVKLLNTTVPIRRGQFLTAVPMLSVVDAQLFIEKLNEKSTREYRLLTETEAHYLFKYPTSLGFRIDESLYESSKILTGWTNSFRIVTEHY